MEELPITPNFTHFYLNSKQPFRCNHWLSNARVILDRHHMYINNVCIIVPVIITYGSLVHNQSTIRTMVESPKFSLYCPGFSTISNYITISLKTNLEDTYVPKKHPCFLQNPKSTDGPIDRPKFHPS